MSGLRQTWQWVVMIAVLTLAARDGWAQIRLPGGIVIGDPRTPQGRPSLPGQRMPTPGRPDPDKVCPKMMEWLQPLQAEYPNVDLAHTVSDKVQRMAVPLFADDSFKKAFGVSYPALSDAERRQFFSTHVPPCQTSRQYAQQTMVLQIFNAPFQPGTAGMGPLSPGQLIPALTELEAARATLQGDEQSLKTAPASAEQYDLAVALPGKRKDELGRVWPSEKTRFDGAVKEAVARSASAAIQGKVEPLLAAAPSPQAARNLQEAPRTFAALFASMPPDQRSALETKLDDRRTEVLREMLPPQRARAEGFPATRQGLDDGAEWMSTYAQVFLQPPVIPEAADVAKAYIARREAVLARMTPQFRHTVETSEDAQAVGSMYDDVFRLPEDRNTEVYRQLATARTARAELLNKRAEVARQAAEERAERAALAKGEIVASSLKTANVSNAAVYKAIYTGDFAHPGVQRASLVFVSLFGTYLEDFGKTCSKELPPNKVEMTVKKCDRWVRTTNRYGLQTAPDQCVGWRRDPIGVFADPRAFAAKVDLEDSSERNMMRGMIQGLADPDPVGTVLGQAGDMVQQAAQAEKDLPRLINENGCGSKALARLQENMTRFASGEDPVHIAGMSSGDASKMTRAQDLDARALADDLIRANASGWLMNRYTGLDGASVDGALDPQGRARHIHASYDQKGIVSSGSVDIAFVDGVPSCLYFSDDPSNCKAPSPSVVKRYEDGAYRRKSR